MLVGSSWMGEMAGKGLPEGAWKDRGLWGVCCVGGECERLDAVPENRREDGK